MTLDEWLTGRNIWSCSTGLRHWAELPDRFEDCWRDYDEKGEEFFWAVDVLEDGTAITLCYNKS